MLQPVPVQSERQDSNEGMVTREAKLALTWAS